MKFLNLGKKSDPPNLSLKEACLKAGIKLLDNKKVGGDRCYIKNCNNQLVFQVIAFYIKGYSKPEHELLAHCNSCDSYYIADRSYRRDLGSTVEIIWEKITKNQYLKIEAWSNETISREATKFLSTRN